MKVYIVTSGSYSDYHIDAVFLDEEKAEMYCAVNNCYYNHHGVEEWDTEDDSIDLAKGYRLAWEGRYTIRGELKMKGYSELTLDDFDKFNTDDYFIKFRIVTHKDCEYERAEKIARDKIAQYLASNMDDDAVAAFLESKKQFERILAYDGSNIQELFDVAIKYIFGDKG